MKSDELRQLSLQCQLVKQGHSFSEFLPLINSSIYAHIKGYLTGVNYELIGKFFLNNLIYSRNDMQHKFEWSWHI